MRTADQPLAPCHLRLATKPSFQIILEPVGIQVISSLINVHKNGLGACLGDGLRRRDERVWDRDHLVPGSDSSRDQPKPEGIRSAVNGDAEFRFTKTGEFLLEQLYFLASHK